MHVVINHKQLCACMQTHLDRQSLMKIPQFEQLLDGGGELQSVVWYMYIVFNGIRLNYMHFNVGIHVCNLFLASLFEICPSLQIDWRQKQVIIKDHLSCQLRWAENNLVNYKKGKFQPHKTRIQICPNEGALLCPRGIQDLKKKLCRTVLDQFDLSWQKSILR